MKSLICLLICLFSFFLIQAQNTEPCAPPCYKWIEGTGTNEIIQEIINLPNGRILAGGRLDNQPILMTITDDLEIENNSYINTSGTDDFIRKMLIDSDGMIILTARDVNVGETQTSMQKINPETGEVIWSKRFPSPAYFNIERFLEIEDGGNYIAGGIVDCDAFIIEINRNTGNINWATSIDAGNCEFFEDTALANGSIFGGGFQRFGNIDKIRASLTRLDMQGNIIWSKHYLTNSSASARTYITGLKATENELFATLRGSLSNDDLTNSVAGFIKFDFEGNPISGKYFTSLEGNSIAFNELIQLSDGWALAGNYNSIADNGARKLFVAKVDNDGNLDWAKKIGSSFFETGNSLTATDKAIIIAGTTREFDGTDGDFLFASLTLDGSGGSTDCDYITDIELEVTDFGPMIYQADSSVSGQSESYNAINFTGSISDAPITEEVLCSELVNTEKVFANDLNISIYPNPSSGQIFLKGINNLQGHYIIYDVTGKEIQTGKLNNDLKINVLHSGVYFFQMLDSQNNLLKTQKLIIQLPRA